MCLCSNCEVISLLHRVTWAAIYWDTLHRQCRFNKNGWDNFCQQRGTASFQLFILTKINVKSMNGQWDLRERWVHPFFSFPSGWRVWMESVRRELLVAVLLTRPCVTIKNSAREMNGVGDMVFSGKRNSWECFQTAKYNAQPTCQSQGPSWELALTDVQTWPLSLTTAQQGVEPLKTKKAKDHPTTLPQVLPQPPSREHHDAAPCHLFQPLLRPCLTHPSCLSSDLPGPSFAAAAFCIVLSKWCPFPTILQGSGQPRKHTGNYLGGTFGIQWGLTHSSGLTYNPPISMVISKLHCRPSETFRTLGSELGFMRPMLTT